MKKISLVVSCIFLFCAGANALPPVIKAFEGVAKIEGAYAGKIVAGQRAIAGMGAGAIGADLGRAVAGVKDIQAQPPNYSILKNNKYRGIDRGQGASSGVVEDVVSLETLEYILKDTDIHIKRDDLGEKIYKKYIYSLIYKRKTLLQLSGPILTDTDKVVFTSYQFFENRDLSILSRDTYRPQEELRYTLMSLPEGRRKIVFNLLKINEMSTSEFKKYAAEKNELEKIDELLSSEPLYQKWPYDSWYNVDGVIDVGMGDAFVAGNTMPFRFLRTNALGPCIGLVITARLNDTILNIGLAHISSLENFNSLLKKGFLTKVRGDGLKADKFEISMTASASNKEFAVRILHEILKYTERENITVTGASDLFKYSAVAVDLKTGSLYTSSPYTSRGSDH